MSLKLVSLNPDLQMLVDKGFAVDFDSNYLIVRDVPYLDAAGADQVGAFVTKLVFLDGEHVAQDDHQVFFAGGVPHGLDGNPIPNLGGGPTSLALSPAASDITVERSFSNKPMPAGAFTDFYAKISSYTSIIAGPAMERYGVSPYTFRVMDRPELTSVFKFRDTMTSRAEITDLSAKFQDDVIALIGLGGTGGYLLDFIAKMPVKEVRAFDGDFFHIHNAYRAPGRTEDSEFGQAKADVFRARYDNFRHGLTFDTTYVDAEAAEKLAGVTFAFVCVDKGPARAGIFELLISLGIPFIDVGMGLSRRDGGLKGMTRVTYYSAENAPVVRDKGYAELAAAPDGLYRTNVQISELNALNAALAVIKFKQLRGFYVMDIDYHHLLFSIADLRMTGEHQVDED